ncbi:MAG: hypothetical protein FD161_39 [Limisphaerales bacterium]|nr:MAG: hypothetical protein FD161_39 [Limisphaerales bacterium]KAG0510485.1 MAG: hypothetical protein E1N63_39 [Limisphaerales bacterium]TXT52758.1 MAG: hypothetical protein FD140_301 [Limisphaerales bacterium]
MVLGGLVFVQAVCAAEEQSLDADLLIVGGNESGCAAAVQAARLGVQRIVLVNDIEWLGGQFSAEGVGCIDEWTTVRGKRVNFPRSGLFLEVMQRIRAHNSKKFGLATPGNAFCGTDTIEPAAAARIFEELLAPYAGQGKQIQILRGWEPVKVSVEGKRVTGVTFARSAAFTPQERPSREAAASGMNAALLSVRAKLTVDSSDWGDVIRFSGAKYAAGPDLKSRFGEASAPEKLTGEERNEMNPLSWCVVLREAGRVATIPAPVGYDPRSFAQLDKTPPWVDSAMTDGIYSPAGWSVYTHRRLVDRWHNGFPVGTEKTLLNWPVQDYPLFNYPKRVADALEATEKGASQKNIAAMTPAQRRIVFADAKAHALGLVHHLQTQVHDRVGDFPQSFRHMELTDEFGTPDRLPPKPYVREGLRLEALYMLREQDIRAADRNPRWAKVMVPDAVFGFQFNIDFHPTRRKFLTEDLNGPWQFVHTPTRNWHTDTDRGMFPYRSLVPVERDGLFGCSKNVGYSSVVSSAVRLHGHMMLVGQAVGTAAWLCLRDAIQPRDIARDWPRIRELQLRLVRGAGGPGVLLWPFHDLAPDDLHFEAANQLAVRGIWQADADNLDFSAWKPVTRRELARALYRLKLALADTRGAPATNAAPRHRDLPLTDPDRVAVEGMVAFGEFGPQQETFGPQGEVNWGTLHRWLTALKLPANAGLARQKDLPLTRAELATHLWAVLKSQREWLPDMAKFLQSGSDLDGDGVPDLEDGLPLPRRF